MVVVVVVGGAGIIDLEGIMDLEGITVVEGGGGGGPEHGGVLELRSCVTLGGVLMAV